MALSPQVCEVYEDTVEEEMPLELGGADIHERHGPALHAHIQLGPSVRDAS